MTEICAAFVVLTNLWGTVSVDLDGGRVVSYVSHGEEQLWMPEPPQSAPGWRHGGIPLCWPWFGVNGKGEIHGTAWHSAFELSDVARGRDECRAVLELRDGCVFGKMHIDQRIRQTHQPIPMQYIGAYRIRYTFTQVR